MADPAALALITGPMATLGIKVPAEAQRLTDVHKAARTPDATDALLADLDTLTPDNAAERLHQAALDQAARQASSQLLNRLSHRIGEGIATAYRTDGDRIVADLHKRMKAAAPIVTEAAKHFRPADTPGTIIDKGKAATDAYLALREQLDTLDLIHQVRRQLSVTCGYGRSDVPAAMFIAPPNSMAAMQGADSAYRDTGGTGGRWLALVKRGKHLQVNTAEQVDTMVAGLETKAAEEKARRNMPISRPGTFAYRSR